MNGKIARLLRKLSPNQPRKHRTKVKNMWKNSNHIQKSVLHRDFDTVIESMKEIQQTKQRKKNA